MGMSIDDIKHCLLVMIDCELCEECNLYGITGTDHCEHDCVDGALHIIDKYQKIEKIVKFGNANELGFEYVGEKITEVVEDGSKIY